MKTILYYTDASYLLTEPDRQLSKIHKELDIFLTQREKIRIVWYHDSTQLQLLSMAEPSVMDGYLALLDRFEREALGEILQCDESEHRDPGSRLSLSEKQALQGCDAYFGDGCFLANCCRVMGKPVMIRSLDL